MELPFLHAIEESAKKTRQKSGFVIEPWPVFVLGLLIFFVSFLFFPWEVDAGFSVMLFLSPLWLPALVVGAAFFLWVTLKRSLFIASQNYLLLEVIPPRSVEKTPLAMETVLAGMHHSPGEGTWYNRIIQGRVRPYWSLEIASLEGQVHFFIWTRAQFRKLIEAQIYSQYPGAQVVEAQDYTRLISAKEGEFDVWGCDFIKTTKDPLPIKTYVEYGLDKVQKEPEQVDPLANLVEFMGSLGKGEYLWLQYIIRVTKGEKYHGELTKDGKPKTWKEEAAEMVEEMRKKTRMPFTDPDTGKELPGFPNPTKGQSETMAAIERNVSKLGFDVGIRGVYLARKGRFDAINITGLTGIFKQFSSENWNGFKPTRWLTVFSDYPWEIGTSRRKAKARKEVVEAYKRRQFYYEPFAFEDYATMSTEEIATIYHVPSRAVEAPSLPRVQSMTAEAPVNLPT